MLDQPGGQDADEDEAVCFAAWQALRRRGPAT
jgi:hypothetical protein